MFNQTSSQQRRKANRPSPVPAMERLEDRTLLAGNVVGVVVAGTLTLTGDAEANTFVVDQAGLAEQRFRVTPDATTEINSNGVGVAVIFNVVKKDVKMNLLGGNDTVTFDDVNLLGNVTINGGDGDNSVTFDDSTVVGHVTVRNGSGTDLFSMVNGSRIDHNVRINNGNGDSDTTLDNSIIRWNLSVQSGAGDDQLDLLNVSLVNRHVRGSFGKGDTSTLIDASGITGRLFIKTGVGGTDDVEIRDSNISRGADLKSGGELNFVANNTRFDDNVAARGKAGLNADLTNDSYFAFKLALAGGSTADSTVNLDTVTVNGALTIRTAGGDDTVTIEDSTFNRTTSIRLDGGSDELAIERTGANPGLVTTFAGRFTFIAGAGDDSLAMGIPANAGNQVVFGGKSFFNGGPGDDTHTLPENVIYGLPPKFVSF